MNTLSSEQPSSSFTVPVTTFLYRDMRDPSAPHDRENRRKEEPAPPANVQPEEPSGPSPQQIDEMISQARAEAIAETESRLKSSYETRLEAKSIAIRHALEEFQDQQKSYFARVEAELVQLSLAIAAKILHREAQVDPLLVAALVRVAVDKLHDNSKVVVRVAPEEAARWGKVLSHPSHGSTIQVVPNPDLGPDDCVLETELGSANFSIDAQLKEVERGFFDLLAQRPGTR